MPEPVRSVRWLDSAGLPASGRGGEPWPARDGSAATHLEGLLLFMQDGPPPSSRTAHGAAAVAERQQRWAAVTPRTVTWQGCRVDMDAGAGLLHRLTSYAPDRDWDSPVDDPRVRHDLISNDMAT